jgi:ribosomal protein S12 methylthiotransferase
VVVEEAKRLVNLGIREIVLVAQDLTSYGTDLKDKDSLVKLLRELEAIPELRWIRLMYAYPWNFTDELLELIRTSSKVLRYVDMPLQHVSEHILQDMRRNVQRDAQKRLLGRLREIEGMVIRTTLISGFPGETDADHRELVDWVREVQFDRVGVFAYSQEPGTPAGERKDQVPKRVREARRKEILAAQQDIHAAKMEAMIGRKVEVLVDGVSEEHGWVLEGRYYGQAPDIDGVVVLSMEDPDVEVMPGRFVQATITAASEYDLVGAVGGAA